MTDPKDFEGPEGGREVGGQGSDANASGPAAGADDLQDAEELTVDDILNTAPSDDALAEDAALADAEHTLLIDLKRLQAEYANYRRRTEEQRGVEIQRAKGEAAKGLLPVLDDLDRAAQHGDLQEGTPFAAIAEKVRSVVERLGVVSYGEKGDEFDPQQHEAIFQQPTPGVEKTVVLEVVEVGYRLGDIELRPAKVVVAVPAE
ncbi:nucleotide exchange factor GrpE [Microbacterium azadirachtae]|uniref:nucleotide exchange factor GrpE n=1 Tax=Microbacterium azadirachtae TaxID=582680 RepID=UPI0008894446|nr:nucleotide exchange factor GrpE [Microbacterium azadirachtae]UXW85714.1 nucleotide exchange factor GrpE [Microbacterium azadirachtae]SDL74765.1 molecular chaperone GrpE [Microbacterium azadirachtae]SEG03971.1 molecular chaperone GrpE [Microbacterium azadirachtae]SEG06736.1 molecular chaperone GrpE [Microbacterium azadirachtae]